MFNIFFNTLFNIINDNVPAYKHIKKKVSKIYFTFKSKMFKIL